MFIVVVVVVAVVAVVAVAVAVVAVVVLQAFNARCMDTNTAILTELCVLRNEKALILGYPDHASFVLDVRMAKTQKQWCRFCPTCPRSWCHYGTLNVQSCLN